jgi:hypothetical protein
MYIYIYIYINIDIHKYTEREREREILIKFLDERVAAQSQENMEEGSQTRYQIPR